MIYSISLVAYQYSNIPDPSQMIPGWNAVSDIIGHSSWLIWELTFWKCNLSKKQLSRTIAHATLWSVYSLLWSVYRMRFCFEMIGYHVSELGHLSINSFNIIRWLDLWMLDLFSNWCLVTVSTRRNCPIAAYCNLKYRLLSWITVINRETRSV